MDDKVKYLIYGMIIVLGAFIIFLVFNQKVTPGTSKYYNGFDTFDVQQVDSQHGPTYKTIIYLNGNTNPYNIYTRYSPEETEDMNFEFNLSSKVVGKKEVFITLDPFANLTGETTLAALEIDKFIDNSYLFSTPVNSAFTQPYQNYTIKNCEDANETSGVILLQTGPETKAYSQGNCVVLQGATQPDITRLADGLIFRMLRIVR
ncbi:MAG: hypothetical protein V1645_03970 [archaeon]